MGIGSKLVLGEEIFLATEGTAQQSCNQNKIKDSAIKIAEEANRPYRYLTSPKQSKEKTAKEIMEADNIQQGLICVLSSVELCRSFNVVLNKKRMNLNLTSWTENACTFTFITLMQ